MILNFFTHYFSQFRLHWNKRFLAKIDMTFRSGQSVFKEYDHVYLLNSRLLSGWYMLEIELILPTVRVNAEIYLKGNRDESTYGFPLYSGRVCKRLIWVNPGEKLRFGFTSTNDAVELRHFKLARVKRKFALDRMLIKLTALHSQYKRRGKHQFGQVIDFNQIKREVLWNDYCALFEAGAEVAPYANWIAEFDNGLVQDDMSLMALDKQCEKKPLMSLIMPVYNPNPAWLTQAINSVQNQHYPYWELCIADDVSTNPEIRRILDQFMKDDQRIRVVFREKNGHISAASNSALSIAKGDWLVLLDHDDLIPTHALHYVVHAINQNPDIRLLYSDEDKIDESGVRSDAYFKPDWNQDLFYSQNMFSHLGVYHTDLVRQVGGFREGLEGSQDYDLALRCIEQIRSDQICHIPHVLYHWRIHAESTAHSMDAKPYAMVAGERALNEHFSRLGLKARAEAVGYGYRVHYALPIIQPLVSLVIPTRNGLKLLKQCIHSIVTKTSYANYEILVIDNGSDDAETLQYLQSLTVDSRIRVIRDDGPFNYSALNNSAVGQAKGEIVGLVNNDIEVINADWLSEMVSHVMRPEVGAVGARLWYSDDTIQHAGVILGIHGIAGHVHRFLPRGNAGYCGRAGLIQSFSVVTAACLLVRKVVYQEMGGLNEVELQVACNDVDFCLRLREAGYRNIWTPYAELYHHESASRGFDDTPEKQERSAKEVAYMQQRWGDLLINDPAYNPNLTLDNEDFTLAWPPRIDNVEYSFTGIK